MGVYIFRSKHSDWIKIGHHKISKARPNVYYRVANRGFHSCVHPHELDEHLNESDFTLLRWYPNLTRRDETKAHRSCCQSCGEFHPFSDFDNAIRCLDGLGDAVDVGEEERQQALAWAKRQRKSPP